MSDHGVSDHDPRSGPEPVIEVEDLFFTYPGADSAVVRGVSFEVPRGEIFGLLGPSGAGKSTTQHVLIGLLKGYRGRVRIFGQRIEDLGCAYYERLGVGFELPNHYPKLSARENLQLFASFYRSPTQAPEPLLDRVGLLEHADKRVEEFSKGMKMRLSFVRLLLHEPDLLFLDEPTSGLDPANARILKDIVREQQARGKTIFLTTHNMQDAEELCDRIAFLADGEIQLIDSPKALRTEHAYRRVTVEYRDHDRVHSREFSLDGLGENQGFLELIRERELVSLHSQEPTLDDLFIRIKAGDAV